MGAVSTAWDTLFDALVDDGATIGRRVRAAMQEQLPAYHGVAAETLDRDVCGEVKRVLTSARMGREAVDDRELAPLAAIGEARAMQGVPVDEMLRAWRIGVEVTVGHAREVGRRLGVADGEVLEFVQSVLAWSDVAMVMSAGAHREAELERAGHEKEHRATFVNGVLLGSLAPAEVRVQAAAYGLDTGIEYVAVRGRSTDECGRGRLERALGFHEAVQHRRGLAAAIGGDLAGFLLEPPRGGIDGPVGVGPPRPLDRLADSFRLATRALDAAAGFGMTGVHDLAGLGLLAAVAADSDVGDALCARYLEPLVGSGSAAEVVASLRVYFACGMHVERAAERLFVHQNTVRYRISRFEELTGANLREPAVAFEVWWALQRAAMGTASDPPR